MNALPGWYPDQSGRLRYWDGNQWGQFAPTTPPLNPTVPSSKGFAITALVLGIVSIFSALISLVTGPLAIIFGSLAVSRANASKERKGMAVWGIVLGGLSLIYAINVLF